MKSGKDHTGALALEHLPPLSAAENCRKQVAPLSGAVSVGTVIVSRNDFLHLAEGLYGTTDVRLRVAYLIKRFVPRLLTRILNRRRVT